MKLTLNCTTDNHPPKLQCVEKPLIVLPVSEHTPIRTHFRTARTSVSRTCNNIGDEHSLKRPGFTRGSDVPVHPAQRRELKFIDRFPGARFRGTTHQLSLVVPVHGLSEGIVRAVTDGSDRGCNADLSKIFPVPNRREFTARIAMTAQRREVLPRDHRAISIVSSTVSAFMFDAHHHPAIERL